MYKLVYTYQEFFLTTKNSFFNIILYSVFVVLSHNLFNISIHLNWFLVFRYKYCCSALYRILLQGINCDALDYLRVLIYYLSYSCLIYILTNRYFYIQRFFYFRLWVPLHELPAAIVPNNLQENLIHPLFLHN